MVSYAINENAIGKIEEGITWGLKIYLILIKKCDIPELTAVIIEFAIER